MALKARDPVPIKAIPKRPRRLLGNTRVFARLLTLSMLIAVAKNKDILHIVFKQLLLS